VYTWRALLDEGGVDALRAMLVDAVPLSSVGAQDIDRFDPATLKALSLLKAETATVDSELIKAAFGSPNLPQNALVPFMEYLSSFIHKKTGISSLSKEIQTAFCKALQRKRDLTAFIVEGSAQFLIKRMTRDQRAKCTLASDFLQTHARSIGVHRDIAGAGFHDSKDAGDCGW
jgi:hypothetical protein